MLVQDPSDDIEREEVSNVNREPRRNMIPKISEERHEEEEEERLTTSTHASGSNEKEERRKFSFN